MIQACSASLAYEDHGREVFACRDIDLEVHENEFLGILGPSGCGKSSLLYLLSGLKIPTGGRVLYDGADLSRMSDDERSTLRISSFSFMFQQPYLLGYLTALENVLVATPKDLNPAGAMELLERLGLGHKTHRHPHELSGGERQRVCVARALRATPRVIFADEPTASLDHRNGLAVVKLLNSLRGSGSLVMVTHDPTMLTGADRVVRLADGRVENP